MTPDTPLTALKAAARAAASRARRATFDAPDRAARVAAANALLSDFLVQRLGALRAGAVLSGYMPMRTEIDPLPAMCAHPGPVCVPVIQGPGQPLRFRAWAPDARMVPGPFGAEIPEKGEWRVPQVLIVPMLAFDAMGYRLGYGGGFYDRTLAALRACAPGNRPVLAIGLAFAAQAVAEIPRESTDERLDAVVTENGVSLPPT